MKFDEALGTALRLTPDAQKPRGDDNYAKILALLWTMIAVSQNVLDDTVYIDDSKNIVSVPLQKSSDPKKTAASNEDQAEEPETKENKNSKVKSKTKVKSKIKAKTDDDGAKKLDEGKEPVT